MNLLFKLLAAGSQSDLSDSCHFVCQDKLVVIPEPRKEWKPSDPREFNRNVMGKTTFLSKHIIQNTIELGI